MLYHKERLQYCGSHVLPQSKSVLVQFFMTCGPTKWLDDKHVCFGRVLDDGLLIVRKLENVQVNPQNSKPRLDCRISQCGEM